MAYTAEQADYFEREALKAATELQDLNLRGLSESRYANDVKARNHLLHGAGRRLGVMKRSLEQIFAIYPPGNTQRLHRDALTDLQTYLHAFVINLAGIFDNWAWAYVLQHRLLEQVGGRNNVSVFKPPFQKLFPAGLAQYLATGETQKWHSEYAKEYRDALAHRIPLYVPPFNVTDAAQKRFEELEAQKAESFDAGDYDRANELMDEQDTIGTACPYFLQDVDEQQMVYLHPQTVCDALTVAEFGRKFYDVWRAAPGQPAAR